MRGLMAFVPGKASAVAARRTGIGRLAAWAGVLALVLQILLPAGQAGAALSVDLELAASICHSGEAGGTPVPSKAIHDHCQYCQIHAGAKLLLAPLSWSAAPIPPIPVVVAAPEEGAIPGNPGHLPHPQRGPPSFS